MGKELTFDPERLKKIRAAMGGDPDGVLIGWYGGEESGRIVCDHTDPDLEGDVVLQFLRVLNDIGFDGETCGNDTRRLETYHGVFEGTEGECVDFLHDVAISRNYAISDCTRDTALRVACKLASTLKSVDGDTGKPSTAIMVPGLDDSSEKFLFDNLLTTTKIVDGDAVVSDWSSLCKLSTWIVVLSDSSGKKSLQKLFDLVESFPGGASICGILSDVSLIPKKTSDD